MAKNVHRVQKKQWAKWTKAQQAMFNRVYASLRYPAHYFPEGMIDLITVRMWNVVRWNISWTAAAEAEDMMLNCRGEAR